MNYKNIGSALSIGVTALLGSGCSDESSGSNAEISGVWTKCVVTYTSASMRTSKIIKYDFKSDGRYFAYHYDFTGDSCSTPVSSSPSAEFYGSYNIGDSTVAVDGSSALKINMNSEYPAVFTTYTIYQIDSNVYLYWGEYSSSSAGKDGDSEETRYDGLGSSYYIKSNE